MSHHMTSKKYPSQWLAKVIWGVDDSRDVTHLDILLFGPILNGKMLDIDGVRFLSELVEVSLQSLRLVF